MLPRVGALQHRPDGAGVQDPPDDGQARLARRQFGPPEGGQGESGPHQFAVGGRDQARGRETPTLLRADEIDLGQGGSGRMQGIPRHPGVVDATDASRREGRAVRRSDEVQWRHIGRAGLLARPVLAPAAVPRMIPPPPAQPCWSSRKKTAASGGTAARAGTDGAGEAGAGAAAGGAGDAGTGAAPVGGSREGRAGPHPAASAVAAARPTDSIARDSTIGCPPARRSRSGRRGGMPPPGPDGSSERPRPPRAPGRARARQRHPSGDRRRPGVGAPGRASLAAGRRSRCGRIGRTVRGAAEPGDTPGQQEAEMVRASISVTPP